MSDAHDSHHDHDHDHAHTGTFGYIMVFLALMVLTFITWWTATKIDLEFWNLPLALVIAFTKASLVLYYFMHLREAPKIVKATGITGFIFVGIMLMFFITDMKARSWQSIGYDWPATNPNQGSLGGELVMDPMAEYEVEHVLHSSHGDDHGDDHSDSHAKEHGDDAAH